MFVEQCGIAYHRNINKCKFMLYLCLSFLKNSVLQFLLYTIMLHMQYLVRNKHTLNNLTFSSNIKYEHLSACTHRYNISQRQELSTIQRQLNNPVYDTSMELHNAYSSSGPTYEQVASGNGQDSILERDKNTNRRSNQLNPIDEEQNYHVVESGRCQGVEGAGCDSVYSEASNYKVTISSKTDSKVWLCEEEYSTLKH